MSAPSQRYMPRCRRGHTTAVTIGGERYCITANQREDGSLGEVFIQSGKHGATGSGLMDSYATALSAALRHQVPLPELLRHGLDLYSVPNGRTNDPDIPAVRSGADYISRRLAIDWLPYSQRADLGIFTLTERVQQASARIISQGRTSAAGDRAHGSSRQHAVRPQHRTGSVQAAEGSGRLPGIHVR